jgi:hypothetical protein
MHLDLDISKLAGRREDVRHQRGGIFTLGTGQPRRYLYGGAATFHHGIIIHNVYLRIAGSNQIQLIMMLDKLL